MIDFLQSHRGFVTTKVYDGNEAFEKNKNSQSNIIARCDDADNH